MKTNAGFTAMASAKQAKSRILVVDDCPLLRKALTDLINCQKDLLCCGEAASISAAREAVNVQKPDLVLVDLRLREADGLDLIGTLRADFPGIRILALSQLDEMTYAERALRAGANGYVMKERAPGELLDAIRVVLAGQTYASQNVVSMAVQRMIQEHPPARQLDIGALTDRELQVLKSIGAGHPNRQIAAELSLSVKTIEAYRERIKYKMGFSTGSDLVHFAGRWLRNQMGDSPPPGV